MIRHTNLLSFEYALVRIRNYVLESKMSERPWDKLDAVRPSNLINIRLSDKHKAMFAYMIDQGGVKSGHAWLHANVVPLIEEAAEKVYQARQDGWKPPI